MDKKFIPSRDAVKILGVHYQTLYRYEKAGIIETIRTPGGKRLYNVETFLSKNTKELEEKNVIKEKICYCRVSTNSQKNDLMRQVDYMKNKYPDYTIITDIGSGINFKRKGLQKIIRLAIDNKIDKIVVAYKDRLCRMGYDMIEFIIQEYSNGEIIIENDISLSPEEEVVKDLLQILTVFSARVNGLRSYKKIIQNDNSLQKKHNKVEEIVENEEQL